MQPPGWSCRDGGSGPASIRARVAQRGGWWSVLRAAATIVGTEGLGGLRLRLKTARQDVRVRHDPDGDGECVNALVAGRAGALLSGWHLRLIATRSDTGGPADDGPTLGVSLTIRDAGAALPRFLDALLSQSFPLSRLNVAISGFSPDERTRAVLDAHRRDHGARHASFTICDPKAPGPDHDLAISHLRDAFVLLSDGRLALAPGTLDGALRAAMADAEDVAAWDLRQSCADTPGQDDPVTLETARIGQDCVLMRRAAYLQVGGHDQRLVGDERDRDLSRRLRAVGWRLRYLPWLAPGGPCRPEITAGGSPHPLVTVITRTHGASTAFLREAMASVLNQTYPAIEHLVVEDRTGFAAELVGRAARAYGSDIRYLRSHGSGRSAAGNLGLARARGDLVMFLDHDDLLFPDHVELLVRTLQTHPDLAGAYALAWEVHTRGDGPGRYRETLHALAGSQWLDFDRRRLMRANFIPIQTMLFRRSLFEIAGGFRDDLDHLEDWNLWARYARHGDFMLLRKITSLYRTPAEPEIRMRRQADLRAAYRRVRALNARSDSHVPARAAPPGGGSPS